MNRIKNSLKLWSKGAMWLNRPGTKIVAKLYGVL